MAEPTVYLVSCVGKKCGHAAQANDLYISEWFVRARAYVERSGCPWFILSAKFGLITPEQVIELYELTLNNMAIAERRAWATRVQLQMARSFPAGCRCVVLAGHRYREVLMDFLVQRYTTDVPMRGLAIGTQFRWLATH
ncbi:DUF6884 domain-containing protein [Ralstonia solanacearum]|uniref:DUF6884 domain-containing protein n=1 Tax=Ralstonia solanacearum TaxID=305 RepID=A0AAD0S9K4_RALSL|nr:DUF6884 domain-containing protein [Ralstonia solanacearum]AXV82269.1 hypothetical protein CJO77_12430 [Ralstonia solanacearum]AXW53396.1 hypothetical protein CJO92_12430 [Ralstonia solanacearum]